MGLLSSLAGIAAPIVGGIFGGPVGSAIGGALGGAISSSSAPKSQTTTQQQSLDPRIEQILFGGSNGNGPQQGLLSQYQGMLNQPQSQASQNWANANANYLNQNGAGDMGAIRNSALGLMGGNQAPMSTAATSAGALSQGAPAQGASLTGPASQIMTSYAQGNMVNAPAQNNIDLTSTYGSLLNGGDTTQLMNSLQAGNALAGAQFKQNQSDMTDNLQRNVLPGIRSNSVLAGQYGGSRQGIAEGNAISDYTKQLTNSNTQFGLGATAANSSALANAYENGQNRALSAAQGLSAQQYATAAQNAATKNQAEFMNVGNEFNLNQTNAGFQQQANLANQQAGQQQGLANQSLNQQNQQFNAGQAQQNNQFNAGLQQQTGLANQNAQLTTNAQNNSAALGGSGLLGGLLSSAGNNVNAQDNYNITRAQQVNGLLAPYLGANSSSSTTSPLYSNAGNSILGGALSGGSLANLFGVGGSSSGSNKGSLLDLFGSNSSFSTGF